jgi:hypothetical protein
MLRQGKPLASIEEEIEGMPISEDAKAWLWLIAYSGQPQHERDSVHESVVPLG